MSISKLVFKTALSTIVLFLSLTVFVFNILVLFFPRQTSDFFDNTGIGALAISLSQNIYKQSNDINDISVLIERAVKYNRYDILVKYIPDFKAFNSYPEFVSFKDSQGVSGFSDYNSYIEGNYLISLYVKKNFAQCISEINKYLSEGYPHNSPLRFLVRHICAHNQNYNDFTTLLTQMYKNQNTILADKINLCVDIYSIYLNSGDKANSDFWKNEYIAIKN